MLILGIETSCDETSVALIDDKKNIYASEIFSQADIHAVFGGVIPEVASRNHLMKISPLFDKVMEKSGKSINDIDLIAVTASPGLVGALFVGVSFAKGLSYALQKPIIPVNHLAGHMLACELTYPTLTPPYIALIVSGGHTHIYDITEPLSFKLWCRTLDDAAGEAFDKVAKMLGGRYPGGPFVEKLAQEGNPLAIKFPIAMRDKKDFSFSGLKTSVMNKIASKTDTAADIAASFQKTVADTLSEKAWKAAVECKRDTVVVSGGVACNKALRHYMTDFLTKKNIKVLFPAPELCSDNAIMIAYAGYRLYNASSDKDFTDLSFGAKDTAHEIIIK